MQPVARPPGYPHDGCYADLLLWHLYVWGTRPGGSTAKRGEQIWSERTFKDKVFKYKGSADSARKSYLYWTGDERCSAPGLDFGSRIAEVLFGGEPQFMTWADDLERARGRSMGKGNNVRHIDIGVALAELDRPPPNTNFVPPPTDYFLGRSKDVDVLASAIMTSSRAVLVQGGPGMGKTELTKAVAHRPEVAAHFAERRWFVPLEQATTADAMREVIVGALGNHSVASFRDVLEMLAESRSLLILDGLEKPWEMPDERQGTESILAELARTPGLSLLGSFRGRDRMKEPNWKRHPVEALEAPAAKELFANVAGEPVIDDPLFDDFTEVLGGIPLAIHLLARRASGRKSLAPLWREWQERGVDLLSLPDEPAGSLSSFSRSILLSLDSKRTTADARRLFGILGHLPTSILDEHVSSIIGNGALDAIESLIHVGLIVENSGRIDLLPPIKDFACRKVLPSNEDQSRVREHYLDFVARLGIDVGTVKDDRGIKRIEAEKPNIEGAFSSALTSGNLSGVSEAFRGFSRFIPLSPKGTSLFREVDDARFKFNQDMLSWSYVNILVGHVNLRARNFPIASRAYDRASMFLSAAKFPQFCAEAHRGLAEVQIARQQYDKASEELEDAYARSHKHEDKQGEGDFYRIKAQIYLLTGDYESCYSYIAYSFSSYLSLDHAGPAISLHTLGEMRVLQQDFVDARGAFEEALGWFRHIECDLWQARCLANIGRCFLHEENYDEAHASLDAALALYSQTDDSAGQAEAKRGLEEAARLRAATITQPRAAR